MLNDALDQKRIFYQGETVPELLDHYVLIFSYTPKKGVKRWFAVECQPSEHRIVLLNSTRSFSISKAMIREISDILDIKDLDKEQIEIKNGSADGDFLDYNISLLSLVIDVFILNYSAIHFKKEHILKQIEEGRLLELTTKRDRHISKVYSNFF